MKPGYEHMRVLVTVKTYPSPSQAHVETVCVAGVRIDTPTPTWVRLYPIPFRVMGEEDRFKKWQIVEVDARPRGASDPRPESYSPDLSTLELGEVIPAGGAWQRRRDILGPLVGGTTSCELLHGARAVTMDVGSPSLGMIKPIVKKVEPLERQEWSQKQMAKVEVGAAGDLFTAPLAKLETPPFRIRYHFDCMAPSCRGHKQEVLDWELGASGYLWQRRYQDQAGAKVLEKWTSMVADDKDVYFFVGNQHQHRESFSVLGVWYPKKV